MRYSAAQQSLTRERRVSLPVANLPFSQTNLRGVCPPCGPALTPQSAIGNGNAL